MIDVGLSASPYYTMWYKSNKTNNNLYFNSHHPQGVSAKHAETILKSAILRTSARSFAPLLLSAFDHTPSPVSADVLYGWPLTDI